jgi:hypothetical protein
MSVRASIGANDELREFGDAWRGKRWWFKMNDVTASIWRRGLGANDLLRSREATGDGEGHHGVRDF